MKALVHHNNSMFQQAAGSESEFFTNFGV